MLALRYTIRIALPNVQLALRCFTSKVTQRQQPPPNKRTNAFVFDKITERDGMRTLSHRHTAKSTRYTGSNAIPTYSHSVTRRVTLYKDVGVTFFLAKRTPNTPHSRQPESASMRTREHSVTIDILQTLTGQQAVTPPVTPHGRVGKLFAHVYPPFAKPWQCVARRATLAPSHPCGVPMVAFRYSIYTWHVVTTASCFEHTYSMLR